ncbi:MAG TPA: hypothetical protein VN285_08835 [Candidatus Deferrimicrobium sp.]|nr:hypothetical protein [Candidatus Deferrimicrobium sp.]
MAYRIQCLSCDKETWATNIIDLIENNTDGMFESHGGKLKCGSSGAQGYIRVESKLQEEKETYIRFIKAVVRIRTDGATYYPYIFLNSSTKGGDVDHLHFNYYKDTRAQPGGKLKHGHGPGGAPVFGKPEFSKLLDRLRECGFLGPGN